MVGGRFLTAAARDYSCKVFDGPDEETKGERRARNGSHENKSNSLFFASVSSVGKEVALSEFG